MSTPTVTDLTRLREHLTRPDGTTILAVPGDPGYDVVTPWNLAKIVTPQAVVRAETPEDVAVTVGFATDRGLRVAVQCTGHGATGMTEEDVRKADVLLVHTGRMNSVEIDPATRVARLGAGVIWQQVIDAAAPYGLAPIIGSAPGVGAVGFLTGGGVGPLVRTFGLSSDRVRAFELVTGNGEIRRVTATENPDLFWGLRGGKGTLGIVTAVEIELVQLAGFYGGAIYFDAEDAAQAGRILHAWRAWSLSLPEPANTSVCIFQLPPLPIIPPELAGRMTIGIRYASTASAAEAADLLTPVRALGTPLLDAIGPLPYTAIGAVHSDPVDPLPVTEEGALLTELPAGAVEKLLELAGPGSGSVQLMVEIRRLGGALGRSPEPPEAGDAFGHREAGYSFFVAGVLLPEIAEIIKPQAQAMIAAMEPWATGGIMPNFASDATPEERRKGYDEGTFKRLADLAESYDPAGTFRIGQVVRN
jgi:hypothetical protein